MINVKMDTTYIIQPPQNNIIKHLTLNIIPSQTGTDQNTTKDKAIKEYNQPLRLNIVRNSINNFEGIPSDHLCYILKSSVSNRTYIGYTINFPHRIRQHNGDIVGGAKRTMKGRPWYPICLIRGFYEASSALRFEYRLQHPGRRKKRAEDAVLFTLQTLVNLINSGDGSIAKNNKMPWPKLNIKWYDSRYSILHCNVINVYQ